MHFTRALLAACGLMLIFGCRSGPELHVEGLTLVAAYKPFHLYIYADTTSTNSYPSFIVREGEDLVYASENVSNEVKITLFEKEREAPSMPIVESDYNRKGDILRRFVTYYDGDNPKFTYYDTNGDGLFDYFVVGQVGKTNHAVFVRSNLCWVPFQKN
jgi:hypothetical protein